VNQPRNSVASLDSADPDGARGTVARSLGEISAPPDGLGEIGTFDAGAVQPLAQQDASLIHLNQFRADLRFAGINGQGETVAILDAGINLNHSFFGGPRFIENFDLLAYFSPIQRTL
jgi:hypothetical protein